MTIKQMIIKLININKQIKKNYNIELENEIQYLGF